MKTKKILPLACALILGATLATPLIAQNNTSYETAFQNLSTSDADNFTAKKLQYDMMKTAVINKDYKTLGGLLDTGINPLIHRELNKTIQIENKFLPLLSLAFILGDTRSFTIVYQAIPEDQRQDAVEEALSAFPQEEKYLSYTYLPY